MVLAPSAHSLREELLIGTSLLAMERAGQLVTINATLSMQVLTYIRESVKEKHNYCVTQDTAKSIITQH